MSIEKDLLNLYASNKTLDEENIRLRDELAATRRESAAALAAAQEAAKKASEPPPSAPAAPPVPLPRNTSEWLATPVAEREKISTEHPGYFDKLLASRPGVYIAPGYDGTLYGPGERRPGGAPAPDLRREEEARARHAETMRRVSANDPPAFSSRNGQTRPAPAPAPFIPPAPSGARKTAVSTAKR